MNICCWKERRRQWNEEWKMRNREMRKGGEKCRMSNIECWILKYKIADCSVQNQRTNKLRNWRTQCFSVFTSTFNIGHSIFNILYSSLNECFFTKKLLFQKKQYLYSTLGVSIHRTEIIPFEPDAVDTAEGKSESLLLFSTLSFLFCCMFIPWSD